MEQDRNWHYMSADEVERAFATGPEGLSEAEAAKRLRSRRNKIWQIRGDLVAKYAKRSLLDPSAVLLLLSVVAAAIYGEGAQAACVLILMLVAKTIEILAFTVADSEFRKNLEASVPRAKVVREGNVKSVPCEMIAEGDVVILDSGDTVPCDIRLTAADGVLVSDDVSGGAGLYIKNIDPISRHVEDVALPLRSNMLYATSTVIYGFCIGVAVATGKNTLKVSRDGYVELLGTKEVKLLERLSELSRKSRLFLVAASFLMIILSMFTKTGLIAAFLPSVAMASACMSEFLAAYGAFAIAMSLRGHRKKDTGASENTVFKVASQMEDAAHSKVIAMRSPALLKCGSMSLHSFYIGMEKIIEEDGKNADGVALPVYACYAAGIAMDGSGGEDFDYISPTFLKKLSAKYATEHPAYMIAAHKSAGEDGSEGLDSSLLLRDNEFVFVCTGEPEAVLARCTRLKKDGEEKALTKDDRETISAYAHRLMAQGVKVCAVGKRPSVYNSMRRLPVLLSDLCFEGFIAISEKAETNAADMINSYRADGGSVVIFSENGQEDLLFAQSCGVFKTGDIYLSEKESFSGTTLPLDAGSLVMISCPTGAAGTERRFKFINILREKMKTAYIGYGAEDAICMQSASVSFACENPTKIGSGIPQSLQFTAGGIIDSRGGGFVGAYRMISRFRGVLTGMRSTLQYLIASQVARALVLLICMVMNVAIPGASIMVFVGLVFDLTCALASAHQDRGGEGELRASAIPRTIEEFLIPAICGTLIAVSSVAMPFVCKMIMSYTARDYKLSASGLTGFVFMGMIFALTVVYLDITSTKGIFAKDTRIGKTKVIVPVLATVILVLSFVFPSVSEAMGISFPGFISIAFAAVPTLLSIVYLAVSRAVVKNKKEK